MEDGTKEFNGIEFRPVTALSVSWMQRNQIFSDEKDLIWKGAAFAFLHCEPFTKIRGVVNDKSAFIDAVDVWIERNVKHHSLVDGLAEIMNDSFRTYMAAATKSEGSGSGN
jgi:hypothetical protein